MQLRAIPLGRFGCDLVVQAKSGTGKTCAFSIIALEAIDTSISRPQVVILAPVREIASQIVDTVRKLGAWLRPRLTVGLFIGGA